MVASDLSSSRHEDPVKTVDETHRNREARQYLIGEVPLGAFLFEYGQFDTVRR